MFSYWLITVIQENKVVLENNNSEMLLRRHCPDVDEDLVFIDGVLMSGLWNFALYHIGNDDLTDQYSMFNIDFLENGGLKVLNPNEQIMDYGAWLAYRNEGLYLGLNFGLDSSFSEFNHRWKIAEVSENRIELHDLSSSGTVERILVLERVL